MTEVIVHPNYKGADKGYDIAIFKVDDEKAKPWDKPEIVQGKNQIYPACLPRVDDQYNSARLWVAGWGLTKQKILRDVRHF